VHADKEPEPLNLGVPVVNFPRANTILARAQALLWVRDCIDAGSKFIMRACSQAKQAIATVLDKCRLVTHLTVEEKETGIVTFVTVCASVGSASNYKKASD
jgi:hypothetical protein